MTSHPVTTSTLAAAATTLAVPDAVTTTASAPRGFILPAGFDLEGHRGARGLKPEDTLPAFEAALDAGVTTLEGDLHFSADDEVVVWHDDMVDPLKCGLRRGAPDDVPDPDDPDTDDGALAVRSLTVEQLSWYQCDRNPDPSDHTEQDPSPTLLAGNRYGIVTLDQFFDFVEEYAGSDSKTALQREGAATVAFNLETKRKASNPAGIGDGFDGVNIGSFEKRVLEVIDERGMKERVTIESFNIKPLRAIHRADPSIPLSYVVSGKPMDFSEMASWGITSWSPDLHQVSASRVDDAHAAGLRVVPWTIRTVEEAERLVAAGVDGLITDRPDLFTVAR